MSQPLSDFPSHGLVASHVSVTDRAGHVIVDDVSVHAYPGRTLVIVGESGAGKSMLARTLCALTPSALSASGTVSLGGEDYDLATNQGRLKKQRGGGIVWLPQDPFTSLAPTIRCAKQVTAARTGRRSERAQRSRALLAEVGLDARVAGSYPHELSGGMRQRVAIAAALDSEPGVLIADEPTTALDVTTQRDILTLLTRLRDERGMTLVLVTHDLALARQFGDDVIVMKDGQIVEEGPINEVLVSPRHEYTKRLADAEPRIDGPNPRAGHEPHVGADVVVEVRDLTKVFRSRKDTRVALRDVSLNVAPGESIGIVGESGSGKTTLARIIVGLEHADSGTARVNAQAERGPAVGIVFQNPYSALNPARTIGQTLAEAAAVAGRPASDVPDLLAAVDLHAEYAKRRPARLSGGERQRVAIARALATRPRVLIADEAVSALDVSVQASVLELLTRLQAEQGFALLFITHDLAVARAMCDRLVVMKDGVVVEQGRTEEILHHPTKEYTADLLAAVPGRQAQSA